MTVIFSLLIIVCGLVGTVCFIGQSYGAGLMFFAIVALCIVALLGRIAYEKGLFSSAGSANKKPEEMPTNYTIPQPVTDPVDEIKKYKELLDSGAITEEEYNTKKKQLLES